MLTNIFTKTFPEKPRLTEISNIVHMNQVTGSRSERGVTVVVLLFLVQRGRGKQDREWGWEKGVTSLLVSPV